MIRPLQTLMALCVALLLVTPSYSRTMPQERIVALSAEKFKWLIDGEFDKYAALLDPQSEMVHASGEISDKQHDVESWRSGRLKYLTVDIRDAHAKISGSTAVLLGKAYMVAMVGGQRRTAVMQYSEIYVRHGSDWKLFHRHFTKMSDN